MLHCALESSLSPTPLVTTQLSPANFPLSHTHSVMITRSQFARPVPRNTDVVQRPSSDSVAARSELMASSAAGEGGLRRLTWTGTRGGE